MLTKEEYVIRDSAWLQEVKGNDSKMLYLNKAAFLAGSEYKVIP